MSWGSGYWGSSAWGGLFSPSLLVPDDDSTVIADPFCVTNVEQLSLEMLIDRFKRPRIEGMVSALVEPIQRLENGLCDIMHRRLLGNPETEGEQLNVIGRIVGRPHRGGLDDADYLRLIEAQIEANRSSGTPEELLDVARRVMNNTDGIILVSQHIPKTLKMDILDVVVSVEDANLLISFLGPMVVGGFRLLMEFAPSQDNLFTFDSGPGFGGILGGVKTNR